MASILRRGLRSYGPGNDKFVLIFIHDLESWTESRLWEFLSKRISNCNNIIHEIVKKQNVNMESYFIIRINYNNHMDYSKVLVTIASYLSIRRIKWTSTFRIRTFT